MSLLLLFFPGAANVAGVFTGAVFFPHSIQAFQTQLLKLAQLIASQLQLNMCALRSLAR